jgi:hypothetical protein
MITPVKDLPEYTVDEIIMGSGMGDIKYVIASDFKAALAAQDDELEQLRGFVAELKRLTVHPFGYLTYNGICNLLKKHKLDGGE